MSNAASVVKKHLTERPEDMERSLRDLAEELGVSRGTVANVKRELSQNGHSSNGHNGVH